MKKFLPLFLTLGLFLTAGTVYAANDRFSTDLTGAEEVPPVNTSMSGSARFHHDEDDDMIDFRVRINDGTAVTMAHLHCAPKGSNGPVVVHLFGEIPGGFDVDGELADFAIKDANIVDGACSGITDVETLVTAINNDQIYVNVHTVAHPNGEIRGQLGD